MAEEMLNQEEENRKDLPENSENETPKVEPVVEEVTEEENDHDESLESDEHTETDEYALENHDLPDYQHMPVDELLSELRKLVSGAPIQKIKDHVEAIKGAILHELDDIRKEKLEQFVEEGGSEIDFEYHQPPREAFKKLYGEFKEKRRTYYKNLEKELSNNLAIKQDIVKQIKELPTSAETVNDVYNTFKGLIDRWKETGPVPKTESTELWRNYHHHVDNFYEYLRLSKELRELDFQRNLKAKEALVEEAKELAKKEVDSETFNELQKLHKKWKEVGPVDRDHRESMWEKFSEATRTIHDKRHDFFKQLRDNAAEKLSEKSKLVERIEEFKFDHLKSHNAWQNAIKTMDELRVKFKSLGRINLPENDALWERFRAANKLFNKAKNNFYKELKGQQNKNLEKKRALLAKVQELKESSAWKETSNELKRIQQEWKKIGYVPRAESDKVWTEFRAACNHFFDRLTEHNKNQDKALEGNLEKKKEILDRIANSEIAKDTQEAIESIKSHVNEWKSAGRVPRAAMKIEDEFSKAIDSLYDKLNLSKRESQLMKFKTKVMSYFESEDHYGLNKEIDALRRKLDEIKNEILQLETNVKMVSGSDDNPFVKEVKKQVSKLNEQRELFKEKLAYIREERKKAEEKNNSSEEEANNE